jgi:hypothetical protein
MTMLTDKSCCALVAQALLINSLCVEKMSDYYGCCGKFMWPSTPLEDWEANWEPTL